jgi:hypothetical protein
LCRLFSIGPHPQTSAAPPPHPTPCYSIPPLLPILPCLQLTATRHATISRADSRTDWLGSPSLRLPRRAAAAGNFDATTTFNPSLWLQFCRALIEYLRIVVPTSFFVVPIIFLIDQNFLFNIVDGSEVKMWFMLWPGIYVGTALIGCLATCFAKWMLMGYFVKSETPLWSTFVWRTEFINAMCEVSGRLCFPVYSVPSHCITSF